MTEKRKYNITGPDYRFDKVCKECTKPFLGTYNSKYCCVTCLQRNEYAAKMLKFEWRLNKLLSAAKNRSKSKNLEFDLDLPYLVSLWNASDGACVISGRKFDLSNYGKFGQVNPNAPSVDRIIPEKGYTKGNIRLVTYHVNVALSEYGLDGLRSLASDILRY